MLAECKLEVREVKESVSHEFSESYRKLYEHQESSRPSSRPAECAVLSPKSENQLNSQQWRSQNTIQEGKLQALLDCRIGARNINEQERGGIHTNIYSK